MSHEEAVAPTVRFELRLSGELAAAIDEWRRHEPDLPNRTEAVRRLIERRLASGKTKRGTRK